MGARTSQDQHKLQCVVKLPENVIVEDNEYEIIYSLTNVSEIDFPGGLFECHLKYPTWEITFAVQHKWAGIGVIKSGDTLELKPKKIKAVAGPNVFIFKELDTVEPTQKFILVNENGYEIKGGWFIGDLRVRSIEEKNTERSLRITVYSLIILIGAQIFDWAFQKWIANLICIQNLTIFGIILFASITLFTLLIRRGLK